MNSLTQLYNKALANLGLRQLTSDNDNSPSQAVLSANVDGDIEAVLRRHPWNCAIARSTLAVVSTTVPGSTGTAYELPEDCIRVLDTDGREQGGTFWRVEGRTLVCDASEANIKYVRRRTVDQLDSLCAEAVALKLAATCSLTLTSSRERAIDMERKYELAIANAQYADALESAGEIMVPTYLTDVHES